MSKDNIECIQQFRKYTMKIDPTQFSDKSFMLALVNDIFARNEQLMNVLNVAINDGVQKELVGLLDLEEHHQSLGLIRIVNSFTSKYGIEKIRVLWALLALASGILRNDSTSILIEQIKDVNNYENVIGLKNEVNVSLNKSNESTIPLGQPLNHYKPTTFSSNIKPKNIDIVYLLNLSQDELNSFISSLDDDEINLCIDICYRRILTAKQSLESGELESRQENVRHSIIKKCQDIISTLKQVKNMMYENEQRKRMELHGGLNENEFFKARERYSPYRECISKFGSSLIALNKNGTVSISEIMNDNFISIKKWRNVIAVKCLGPNAYIGLKKNGTVETCSERDTWKFVKSGCYDVSNWVDIINLDADLYGIIGLHKNGTVSVAIDSTMYGYKQCDSVKNWMDITRVAINRNTVVALKKDGTVLTDSISSIGEITKVNLSDWNNIIDIAAEGSLIAGLMSNGNVRAIDTKGQYGRDVNVSYWKDVIAIDVNDASITGLRADGTVLLDTQNNINHDAVAKLHNIIAVSGCVVALKKDGTLIQIRGAVEESLDRYKNVGCYTTSDANAKRGEDDDLKKKGRCPYCENKLSFFKKTCSICGVD